MSGGSVAAGSRLTWPQQLLWTGQTLSADSPLYNMALAFEIDGMLDVERFKRAFAGVVARSDALRTVIDTVDGQPWARVRTASTHEPDAGAEQTQVLDLTQHPNPESEAEAWTRSRAAVLLDPSRRLYDSALLILGPERSVWFLNLHHLVTDAWSTRLVVEEVSRAYTEGLDEGTVDKNGAPSYAAFGRYLDSVDRDGANEAARRHWVERGATDFSRLRLYGKGGPRNDTASRRLTLALGLERSTALRELASRADIRLLTEDMSLYTVFATLLFAFLSRVSDQRRLRVASPAHNRVNREFKRTIGLFMEIFPLDAEVNDESTFLSLLSDLQEEALLFARHARPGASDPATNRSCSVMLNYITAALPALTGLPTRSRLVHPGHADLGHDLRLHVHDFDRSGEFALHFDVSTERFSQDEAERLVEHFEAVVDRFLADPSQRLRTLDLVTPAERSHVLEAFAVEGQPEPITGTVVDAFRERVEHHPDRVAVEGVGNEWSYSELQERACALSDRLRADGMKGARVGLAVPRSGDALVGLLGTLMAGAAYVPLDPTHPEARLAHILEEAGIRCVLARPEDRARFEALGVEVVTTDEFVSGATAPPSSQGSELPGPSLNDPAYVLFTSGSTGTPKGVEVNHGQLAHYASWAATTYGGGESKAFPLFTPLTFDLTVTSIFAPLLSGGRIVVYPPKGESADLSLLDVLDDDRVDVIKLTPSHLRLLTSRVPAEGRVKTLVLGGEELTTEAARRAVQAFGGRVTVYNEYGPTESTVACTIHRYDGERDVEGSVPIGRPIPGARLYVVDRARQLMPMGGVGEIAIGGRGVANGYVNRPNETAERFLADPFNPQGRLYLTGDLGRWRSDGTLEFLGRADRQVKVKGVRVELGEIEAVLAAHPRVEALAVELRPGKRTSEAAFHCVRCGIPDGYPDVEFDATGVCSLCTGFTTYETRAQQYFGSMDDLARIIASGEGRKRARHDCLMLLSGGKDSSYALYRLVEMGLDVLAVTLDNGYISDGAKQNIGRVTEDLGVEHEYASTPHMNAIFVDSLQRHANVCNGCFKTMYTLAIEIARTRGIPFIVTGLSRGQFFETRLTEELFRSDDTAIDQVVLDARKAYHRLDDAVNRLLNADAVHSDEVFEQVQFLDFYRYCDVPLDEMLSFLDRRAPWIRPADTGRSTNCLINDVGIFVHKRKRGFHNYAFPYSWDVRVGHKQRDAALSELQDEIDEGGVRRILEEIGFEDDSIFEDTSVADLVVYYSGRSAPSAQELRTFAKAGLPEFMVPRHFVEMSELPLTRHGKVDRSALPPPDHVRAVNSGTFVEARTETERRLVAVWGDVLQFDRVSVDDNFFDLGGDSISAIQIVSRARGAGLELDPNHVFLHQTVRELAEQVRQVPTTTSTGPEALVGPVELTPIQRWFLAQVDNSGGATGSAQFVVLEWEGPVDVRALEQALSAVCDHHAAFGLRFDRADEGWTQRYESAHGGCPLDRRPDPADLDTVAEALGAALDIGTGSLTQATLLAGDSGPSKLVWMVHHLAVDAVSWPVLLEDLDRAYDQARDGSNIDLEANSVSFPGWANALAGVRETEAQDDAWERWLAAAPGDEAAWTPNGDTAAAGTTQRSHARARLASDLTERLISGARACDIRVDVALMAAVATALRLQAPMPDGESRRVWIDVEGHGRDPLHSAEWGTVVDATRSVGWYTVIAPHRLELHEDVSRSLAALDRLRRDRPGPDRELAHRVARGEAIPSRRVLFNYLGRMGLLTPVGGSFRAIGSIRLWRSPGLSSSYDLEVAAFVEDGALTVECTSHRSDPKRSARAARDLIEAAERLIDELEERAAAPGKLASDVRDKVAALLERADADDE